MRRALVALVVAFLTTHAQAEEVVIARCGASDGTVFYFEGGLVPPGQGGWKRDGMSSGKIRVVSKDGALDVRFSDATGERSHRGEGSDVRLVGLDKETGTFLILTENVQGEPPNTTYSGSTS